MVQHLFGQEVSSYEETTQLGAEEDVGIVGIQRQQFAGKAEEEAGTGTDLARDHAGLDDLAAFRL